MGDFSFYYQTNSVSLLNSSQVRREVLLCVSHMKKPLMGSYVTEARDRQTLGQDSGFQIKP